MNIPKSIVVFGSSSAYGKNDIEGGGFAGRLRRWHEEVDIQNKTYNLGIPGAGVDLLLDRMEMECRHRNPDLIILQLGSNDARREATPDNDTVTSLDVFQDKFTTLIEQLRNIAPTLVISSYPFDESRTTPVSWRDVYFFLDDVADYAQEMKNITLRAGLHYLDIFGDWSNMDDYVDRYISDDGLHANSQGHEFIFEKIRDEILSMNEES